jgi:hypothetical protein
MIAAAIFSGCSAAVAPTLVVGGCPIYYLLN